MRTFPARFFGRCGADCGDPVREGQEVAFTAEGAVVHRQCHPDEPARPAAEVCPWCHLEMPATGVCCD